jgi:hypothetical protein
MVLYEIQINNIYQTLQILSHNVITYLKTLDNIMMCVFFHQSKTAVKIRQKSIISYIHDAIPTNGKS